MLCLPGGVNVVPKDRTGTYCKLTRGVLLNHLEQKYAICVYAGKWGSKFMCFDVDDGNRETVFRIISELERLGVPRSMIYVSHSGGKGYHVELFCRDIIPTEQWYWLYLSVIRTGNLDPDKVEFRPTHTQSIKLPLSCHAKSGKVCWYVDRDT